MKRAWVVALTALSCSRSEKSHYTPVTIPSVASVSVSQTEPPPLARVVGAVAVFRHDRLDECITLEAEVPSANQSVVAKRLDHKIQLLLSYAKKDKREALGLLKSCSDQFHDRKAFAVCTRELPLGDAGAVSATMRAAYYDALSLDDDGYMKDCMKLGGEWKSTPRDDPDMARARLRTRAKQLLRSAGEE